MGNPSGADRRLVRVLGFDPADVTGLADEECELVGGAGPAGRDRDLIDVTDLAAEERELADLADALRAAAQMQELAWPEPDPTESGQLVAALAALVPARESPFAAELECAWAPRRSWLAWTLAAVRPQVRVLERPFWLASAGLVAAGLPLLSAGLSGRLGLDLTYGAFLLLVAPVLAALGVAHAFRGTGTGVAELELTCALTPAQLILGRLFWVTAYDALLLGCASLLSAALEPSVRLGWLVLGWLLPLLLLSATVLALSLYVPPRIGGGAALALWTVMLSALTLGRDLPVTAITHPVVLLPLSAACAVGALIAAALIARAWPGLTARLAGLAAREVQ